MDTDESVHPDRYATALIVIDVETEIGPVYTVPTVLPGVEPSVVYRIVAPEVVVDSVPVTPTNAYTFSAVSSNHAIAVTFGPVPQLPYRGTPWPLPGTVQLEDFDEDDVLVQPADDDSRTYTFLG